MRLQCFLSSLLLLATVTTAWPAGWDEPLAAAKHELAPLLAARANNKGSSSSPAAASSSSQAKKTTTDSKNGKSTGKSTAQASSSSSAAKSDKGKSTDKGKGKTTSTDKNGKATTTQSKYETTKTYDDRLPAGGVSMITPGPLDPSQYYKVQDFVTFAWNFTSLSNTPKAVDVLATCSLNSALYTIATNASITGPTQAITWDTGEFQRTAATPLVVATYTLVIHDAAQAISATPRAGYLGTWEQFTFGMYTARPYKKIEDFVCATCNSAGSLERHTMGFLAGMVVVTVMSFTWFAGVAGLW